MTLSTNVRRFTVHRTFHSQLISLNINIVVESDYSTSTRGYIHSILTEVINIAGAFSVYISNQYECHIRGGCRFDSIQAKTQNLLGVPFFSKMHSILSGAY